MLSPATRRVAGIIVLLSLYAPSSRVGARQAVVNLPRLTGGLTQMIDPVVDAAWAGFDADAAMEHVRFAAPLWRLAGNAGYDAVIDRVRMRLLSSGFPEHAVRVESYPLDTPAWDHAAATLALVRAGAPDEVVLSRERERLTLCINSFPTPRGGQTARLVDVGRGDRDADFAGRNVKGAIVLGDADPDALWRRAVVAGGAVGIVSTALDSFISPDPPGSALTPRDEWDILQWDGVPYDPERRAFGFKASPRAAARLRRATADAAGTHVTLRVTIDATFSTKPARTLVAEIPGRIAPAERVVLAAHVQEPGANDNASGVATLAELARALSAGIRDGRISAPGRTITFLWLDEIDGSRQWLRDHPDLVSNIRYMMSLDMTGEDAARTGGFSRIERWPDPGAVWDRSWDPHTEWGRSNVRPESLKGDVINDLHVGISSRVRAAKGAGDRLVIPNPYEGGSDHTVFGAAGIPAVLNWHFTDRYYHTNFDTADKTSPAEMKNVGVAVGASAWLLASANEPAAREVAALVVESGRSRLAMEENMGRRLVAEQTSNREAAAERQQTILAAWRKWYAEAVQSVSRLVVGPVSPRLRRDLDRLAATFQ